MATNLRCHLFSLHWVIKQIFSCHAIAWPKWHRYLFYSLTAIQCTGQDWLAGSTPFTYCNRSFILKKKELKSIKKADCLLQLEPHDNFPLCALNNYLLFLLLFIPFCLCLLHQRKVFIAKSPNIVWKKIVRVYFCLFGFSEVNSTCWSLLS